MSEATPDLTSMTRDELLALRTRVQGEVDVLKAEVTKAKRAGAIQHRYADRAWLEAQEKQQRDKGRLCLEIQNRLSTLNAQRHQEAQVKRAAPSTAQPWTEVEKLAFNLFVQATAAQVAALGLETPARIGKCLAEARAWFEIREADKLPEGFTPEAADFWTRTLEAEGGELDIGRRG